MKHFINTMCFLTPVALIRQYFCTWAHQRCTNHKNTPWKFARKLTGRPIVLWVDHVLNSKTEFYSEHQFKILRKKFGILRLQYFPQTQLYHLTFACNHHRIWIINNLDAIAEFLCEFRIEKIIVNNPDTGKLSHAIAYIKQNCLGCTCVFNTKLNDRAQLM